MLKKICFITIVIILIYPSFLNVGATFTTKMQVDPSTKTVAAGDTFTVDINITSVTDLYAWQFKLYYKNAILNCTSVTEGPFLKAGGNSTFFPSPTINNNYNGTHGRIQAGCSRTCSAPPVGETGGGVLATITFKALSSGNTALDLFGTDLVDSASPGNHMSHTTSDGAVHVESVAGHDVAIIDVIFSKTVVCQGYSVSFSVTAQNQGDYTETFNVTVHANVTEIATELVTLTEGNSTTIEFTWNSTNFALGTYVISAYAHPVPGETDTADNSLADGTVKVTIPGDINGDGEVNWKDLRVFALAYGSNEGEPAYVAEADYNGDGTINWKDLRVLALNYGKTC